MYSLYAVFPQTSICRQRQYSALIRWSAYQGALGVPAEKPAEDFVAQQIIGSMIPSNVDYYVTLTMPYTIAVPNIQTNIRTHLNAYNDEATEVTLDAEVDGAISSFLPKFCLTNTTQAQIDAWYLEHGFEVEPASGVNTPIPSRLGPMNQPM
jgi:hypothetical protein